METYYYPKTIKNIIISILDMFNGITVKRYDTAGNVVKEIAVPITFGPVKKMMQQRLEAGTKKYYLPLPKIALVLNGIAYNPNRAYSVNEFRYFGDTGFLDLLSEYYEDYNPTPYDYNFQLAIRTDSMEDFAQIMENILPYFNPELYLRVKEFSFFNAERDMKVVVNSITPEFIDDQNAEDVRYINGNIDITVQGWMYRPLSDDSSESSRKLIKFIKSNYFVNVAMNNALVSAAKIDEFSTSGVGALSAAPTDFITTGTAGDGYYFTDGTPFY